MGKFMVFLMVFLGALASSLGRAETTVESDTLARAFSANQALLERFAREGERDENERAKRRQKMAVLANANEKIVLQILRDRPSPSERALLGKRWLAMSVVERERAVFAFLTELEEEGDRLQHSSQYYGKMLAHTLELDSAWLEKPLQNLFLYTVYKQEPAVRPVLERAALRDAASL